MDIIAIAVLLGGTLLLLSAFGATVARLRLGQLAAEEARPELPGDWEDLFDGHARYYSAALDGRIAYSEYEGVLDEELFGRPLPDGWRGEIDSRVSGDPVRRLPSARGDLVKCRSCKGSFRAENMYGSVCARCWHRRAEEAGDADAAILENGKRLASLYAAPPMLIGSDATPTLHSSSLMLDRGGFRNGDKIWDYPFTAEIGPGDEHLKASPFSRPTMEYR